MSTSDRLSDSASERSRPLRRVEYDKPVADGLFPIAALDGARLAVDDFLC